MLRAVTFFLAGLILVGQASALDITVATSTPAALRSFLVARSILAQQPDGTYAGTLPGIEYTVEPIPNPVIVTPASGTPGQPGYVPPVYDSRKVYLLRLSHQADAADDDGSATQADDPMPRFTRSRLAQWVKANSTNVTITSAGGPTYRAYRVSATVFIIDPRDAAAFGQWQ